MKCSGLPWEKSRSLFFEDLKLEVAWLFLLFLFSENARVFPLLLFILFLQTLLCIFMNKFIKHTKIKNILRSIGARNYKDLDSAISQAYSQVTVKDIHSWFSHSCYCISPI